jgi:AcrR family transcriptional regulator
MRASATTRRRDDGGLVGPGAAPRVRRTQEERSAEARERLIAAAVEVIAEVGYASASTGMIAERAGLSRGAIQHHFASKADLVVAVMEAIAVELNLRFDVDELANSPIAQRLETIIERYWDVFRGPMFRAGLSIWTAVAGDAALAARVEDCLTEVRKSIAVVWRNLFRDAPCSERELATVLHIVMAAMRGSAIAFMAGRASANFREEREQLCKMALLALGGAPDSTTKTRGKRHAAGHLPA